MNDNSQTIDFLVDRLDLTCCSHCGCEIDVSDITLFADIICPECNLQGTVPCRLGPFIMEDRIGSGAMGTVYRARDEELGRTVAIKVLRKALGERKDAIEKFKLEAVAIARLNHPNIAQVYSFGQEKGQPYIVMEYLAGKTLKAFMTASRFIDQSFLMRVGADIGLALEAADEVKLIHGDVKPANIVLDDKLHAKLVDFGLAKFKHGPVDKGVVGTPYYIAPERVRGDHTDTRADMYSLGACLYHAITNRPPFMADSPIECAKMRLRSDPAPIRKFRKNVDPQVEKIITRLIQRDPYMRYPNYSSLIGDFRRAFNALRKNIKRSPVRTTKRHVSSKQAQHSTVRITHRAAVSSASPALAGHSSPAPAFPVRSASPKRTDASIVGAVVTFIFIALVAIAGIGLYSHNQRLTDQQRLMEMDSISSLAGKTSVTCGKIEKVVEALGDEWKNREVYSSVKVSVSERTADLKIKEKNKLVSSAFKRTDSTVQHAKNIRASAVELQTKIERSRSLRQAQSMAKKMSGLLTDVKNYRVKYLKAKEKLDLAVVQRDKILFDWQKKRAALIAAAEKEKRLAREKIEREKAEKEAAERRDREVAALTTQEIKLVADTYEKIKPYIRGNNFKGALRRTNMMLADIKSPEGIKRRARLVNRCNNLVEMKTWLIERMQELPMKNGWAIGDKWFDIVTADKDGVTITGTIIDWKHVTAEKMTRILAFYLSASEIEETGKARLCQAAMVHAFESGSLALAVSCGEKAVKHDPALAKDSDIVLMAGGGGE